MNIFRHYLDLIQDEIESSIKYSLTPLPGYLRRLSFGVMLLLMGGEFGFLAILVLAIGLFLSIANLPFLAATLYVALAFIILCILMISLGLNLLRPPR